MEFKVPKMHCNGCVKKIQMNLLTKGIEGKFDLDKRVVEIKDSDNVEVAKAAIKAAGYDVLA